MSKQLKACTYSFKGSKFSTYAEAYAAAVAATEYNPEKLMFYSSLSRPDPSKKIVARLEKYAEDFPKFGKKGYSSVATTKLVAAHFPYDGVVTDVTKFKSRFNSELGTLFHRAMETYSTNPAEYEGLKIKMWNLISAKVVEARASLNAKELFEEIALFHVGKEDFDASIAQVAEDISLHTRGAAKVFFEFSILGELEKGTDLGEKYKSVKTDKDPDKPDSIFGKIDILQVNKDGSIIIYDIKTSSGTGSKSGSLYPSHAFQLSVYKNLVAKLGYDSSRILVKVLNVEMSDSGFRMSKEGVLGVSNSNEIRMANELIPLTTVSHAAAPKIKARAEALKMALFETNKLGQSKVVSFAKWLTDSPVQAKTYKTISKDYEDYTIVKVENEIVYLRAKSSSATKMASLADFSKAEVTVRSAKFVDKVKLFKDILANAKDNTDFNALSTSSDDEALNRFYHNLKKYTRGAWQYMENEVLEAEGIIMVKNVLDGTYDFVVLSDFLHFDYTYKLAKGSTILGDVLSDKELGGRATHLPLSNLGNLEAIKALMLVHLSAEMTGEKIVINDIKIVSLVAGSEPAMINLNTIQSALKVLEHKSSDFANLISDQIVIGSVKDNILKQIYDEVNDMSNARLSFDIGEATKYNNFKLLKHLKNMQMIFKQEYKGKLNADRLSGKITTEEDEIYKRIGMLISIVEGEVDYSTINKVSKYGIDQLNFMGVLGDVLKTGEAEAFSVDGLTITGLALGSHMTPAFANPDNMARHVGKLGEVAFSTLGEQFTREMVQGNSATETFLRKQRSFLRILTSGNNNSLYKPLFQIDPATGAMDSLMRFRNPYTDDSLQDFQKEYIETVLWGFNKFRMKDLDLDVRSKKYSDLTPEEKFDYITKLNADPKFLNYPLRTAKNIDLVLNLLSNPKNLKSFFDNITTNTLRFFDGRSMTKDLRQKEVEKQKSLQILNKYSDNEDERANVLAHKGPGEFELNVNLVLNDYVYNELREVIYNEVLEKVDQIVGSIRLVERTTGQNFDATIDAIRGVINIGLYGKNEVSEDLKDAATVWGLVRQFGSYTKIALRPILYVKEMIASSLKLFSAAGFGYFGNDQISAKDLAVGYKLVFGDSFNLLTGKISGDIKMGEFSLANAINNRYRIANMDIKNMAEKLTMDRFGLHNITSTAMFASSTAPDYLHRMAYFVAVMEKAGALQAHSMVDGVLTYDVSKDKRFDEFWAHKAEPNYTSENFIKQKSLYYSMVMSFNTEGKNLRFGDIGADGKPVFDALPSAYTVQQRNSIKEQIGTMLGFYDHEERDMVNQGTFFYFMQQFVTYLSGEVKKYFASGTQQTAMGHEEWAKNEKDELLYLEYDELTHTFIETTDSNDGKNMHALIWVGDPVQGLAVSFIATMSDLAHGNWHNWQDNPKKVQQLANSKLFLFNLLFALFIGKLIHWMFTSGGEEEMPVALEETYKLIHNKVAPEFNMFSSIFGPATNARLLGVEYAKSLGNDIIKVVSNDDYGVSNMINNQIAAAKDWNFLNPTDD